MKIFCDKGNANAGPRFWMGALVLTNLLLFSCSGAKKQSSEIVGIPEVRPEVPASVSEIRELRHHTAKEEGHSDLDLSVQLFSKSGTAGRVRITPCTSCLLTLKGITDTSVTIRMTTNASGYAEFHGVKGVYSVALANPRHNKIVIDELDLEVGGKNHLVLINAQGNSTEKFAVTRTGEQYAWTKVQ